MSDLSRRTFLQGAGLAAVAGLGLVGCGGGTSTSGDDAASDAATSEGGSTEEASHIVQMVTDTGGVNDQSFNQSAWEGMTRLGEDLGYDVAYLESKQESDYATNLDKCVDAGAELIWGVGFAMAEATFAAAKANPDVKYAIIDNGNPDSISNLLGVNFRPQEPSFMVGYIAACFSTTGKVGFVGGISSEAIDLFEFGYKAGVKYANSVKGLNVEVMSQYAESFGDAAKGKSIAQKFFSDGADVVFHAAGGTGTGVIEAAKEAGLYAIGVDMDQSYLAPDNVITSALKLVGNGVYDLSPAILDGSQEVGGEISLGMTEDAVGIPEEHSIIGDDLYNEALEIGEKIKSGEIAVPGTEDEYNAFEA